MAMRILRKEKPGNVAIALKKAYRKDWWFVVVHHLNRPRKYPDARYLAEELKRQFRPVVQTRSARVEKD